MLSVEVSAIRICAVTDRLEHVVVVRHVDVVGEACIPTGIAELVDHACEPVELACIAYHAEVVYKRSIVGVAVAAVDAEAVLVFVRRNGAARRVAVAIDIKRCAVAIELSTSIYLTTFYIIRYGIGVCAEALVPDKRALVAVEREAKFAACERFVGEPVAVGTLMPCALVVEVCEVEAVCYNHRARFIADELAVVIELIACHVSADDVSQIDAVCYRAAALVNPSAEGCCR